jgi:hypothetical protein
LEEEKEICTWRRKRSALGGGATRICAARPRGEEEENEMSRVSGLGLMFLYQARYMWALVDL